MNDFHFHAPETIEEAAALLAQHDGNAKLIAGGTALTTLLKQSLVQPEHLVSLHRVKGHDAISHSKGALHIGALATQRAVEKSGVVKKNAPLLESWQREIVRIVRKIAQYFYPQRQVLVMNEGWATFWHYTLLNDLYDEGLVTDGFMMEFLQSHTSVLYQPSFDSPYFSGVNPYALGFAMFRDIRRICESPTDEDREWFPDLAGSDWLPALKNAMENFKDESFILQYLSPKVMRNMRLFAVTDDDKEKDLDVSAIHDDGGYRRVRELLASQYNIGDGEPNVQVYKVDMTGDRSLTLRHTRHNRRPLGESTGEMLKHVHRLWGFPVHLESLQDDEVKDTRHCPEAPKQEDLIEGS